MQHCANRRRPHRWVGVVIAVCLILGGTVGGSVVYLHRHEGRAPRGTILMGQDVTGMDRSTLTAFVLQRAASASLTLTVDGTPTTVPLARIAQVDARATVEAAVSGAGSLVTHLHGVVGTRQVAVRYVVNKEGRIVPTVSQERVRAWVTSLSTPEERTPVNVINDVDSAGTVLQLARPGKAGRRAGNIEPATTALVQGLGQGRSVSQQISWDEVPHSSENRVVPNGPERFAYQAKAGEKWVDVNLTDSTLTAYEGQKVVYGPILINHGGVGHETVTGTYKIYLRYQAQDMGCTPEWPYCERGVPWVSYWHDSYALHGAPWVKEFGIGTDESSHGCINIPVPDAQAIWQWSEIGTTVVTHY